MKPKVDYVTLFTSALCNLKCQYCYICKNKGLEVIDKELDQCYADTNYFFNLYKNYVGIEGLNDLETIHLMGGEPLLNFARVLPTLEIFIQNCTRLERILIYSNFAHKNVQESIKLLNDMLAKYPNRHFKVELQISIDGPADINDAQRGEGVTERILANLKGLAEVEFYWKPNLTICVHPKSTISPKYIDKFLDQDYTIKYYKFFEDTFYEIVHNCSNPNIQLDCLNWPVIASPWDASKEDGKKLAKLIETFNNLDKLNYNQHIFRYHKNTINWFYTRVIFETFNGNNKYSLNVPYCPYGISRIGLLPGNKYCGCQRSFTDYCEEYLKDYQINLVNKTDFISAKTARDFVYDNISKINLFNDRIARLNDQSVNKTAYISYNLNLVKLLAQTGQIDSKYSSEDQALKALLLIHAISSACAYNNIIHSGHELFNSTAIYKLYLNGAIDKLLESQELNKDLYTKLDSEEKAFQLKITEKRYHDTSKRK